MLSEFHIQKIHTLAIKYDVSVIHILGNLPLTKDRDISYIFFFLRKKSLMTMLHISKYIVIGNIWLYAFSLIGFQPMLYIEVRCTSISVTFLCILRALGTVLFPGIFYRADVDNADLMYQYSNF